jgi:hypothetical protein
MRVVKPIELSSSTQPTLAEFSISRGSPFPLLPDHRPKSASDPLLQLVEHFRSFASSEVADPTAYILGQIGGSASGALAGRRFDTSFATRASPLCRFPFRLRRLLNLQKSAEADWLGAMPPVSSTFYYSHCLGLPHFREYYARC